MNKYADLMREAADAVHRKLSPYGRNLIARLQAAADEIEKAEAVAVREGYVLVSEKTRHNAEDYTEAMLALDAANVPRYENDIELSLYGRAVRLNTPAALERQLTTALEEAYKQGFSAAKGEGHE